MYKIAVIIISLAIALSCKSSYAEERTEPACQNEVYSIDDLMGRLAHPDIYAGTKEPPGRLLMLGPFGDPRFDDDNWEKRALDAIYRNSTTSPVFGFRSTVRYFTQMHYMFNRVTRRAAQIKFHSSVEQGCIGEKIVENPKISSRNGDKRCVGNSTKYYAPAYERTTVYTEFPGSSGGMPTILTESKLVDRGGTWIRERDDCNGK